MIPGNVELIGIDTNVLLRVVLQDDPIQSPLAATLIRSLNGSRHGFITAVTLAEAYWVLSRGARLQRTTCLALIRRLIETASLDFDDDEGVARALQLAEDGADFADALIHETMQQFGTTETVTFDRSAAEKLGWRLLEA